MTLSGKSGFTSSDSSGSSSSRLTTGRPLSSKFSSATSRSVTPRGGNGLNASGSSGSGATPNRSRTPGGRTPGGPGGEKKTFAFQGASRSGGTTTTTTATNVNRISANTSLRSPATNTLSSTFGAANTSSNSPATNTLSSAFGTRSVTPRNRNVVNATSGTNAASSGSKSFGRTSTNVNSSQSSQSGLTRPTSAFSGRRDRDGLTRPTSAFGSRRDRDGLTRPTSCRLDRPGLTPRNDNDSKLSTFTRPRSPGLTTGFGKTESKLKLSTKSTLGSSNSKTQDDALFSRIRPRSEDRPRETLESRLKKRSLTRGKTDGDVVSKASSGSRSGSASGEVVTKASSGSRSGSSSRVQFNDAANRNLAGTNHNGDRKDQTELSSFHDKVLSRLGGPGSKIGSSSPGNHTNSAAVARERTGSGISGGGLTSTGLLSTGLKATQKSTFTQPQSSVRSSIFTRNNSDTDLKSDNHIKGGSKFHSKFYNDNVTTAEEDNVDSGPDSSWAASSSFHSSRPSVDRSGLSHGLSFNSSRRSNSNSGLHGSSSNFNRSKLDHDDNEGNSNTTLGNTTRDRGTEIAGSGFSNGRSYLNDNSASGSKSKNYRVDNSNSIWNQDLRLGQQEFSLLDQSSLLVGDCDADQSAYLSPTGDGKISCSFEGRDSRSAARDGDHGSGAGESVSWFWL
jgi:hypothetical protein